MGCPMPVDPAAVAYVASALSPVPTRARVIARRLGIPRGRVRAALRQLQAAGHARSRARRWTAGGAA